MPYILSYRSCVRLNTPPPSQQEYIKLISGSDARMFPLSPVPFALVRLQVKGERGTET